MAGPLSIVDLELIHSHTRDLWHEVRGQRIFITGGTGFFGCWLVESFLHINRVEKLDAHITVLTRDPEAFARKCPHLASDPALTLHTGDIRSFSFPEGDFRYVIHAATEAGTAQAAERPLEMLETVLHGTERTLQFAAAHGARKFLLTSSGAVYGEQPAAIPALSEDYIGSPDPLAASSVYGESKRAAEMLCALHGRAHGFECKIARCFAFVGPHLPLDAHFAIGNFIRDAMRGEVIRVRGDGTPRRSYMYAADLAIWLWTMLFRAPSMEAFNVGSSHAVGIREAAHTVAATLNSKIVVQVAQEPALGAHPRQYVPSAGKAERQLGLRCTVSLEEAIRRTALWHGFRI
ncbi:MAG TPA: NAD-dependent epimerase/dehydratase family protein [Acidobacteriaceae bacterium]|jgi:dTDP-glucose 4,6-dehydratase|nr:NAD-dependent epimerase/dehydratase family protein [Acidobacteriaceae bacterium]